MQKTIETPQGMLHYKITKVLGANSILKVEMKSAFDKRTWKASYHMPYSHAKAMVLKFEQDLKKKMTA